MQQKIFESREEYFDFLVEVLNLATIPEHRLTARYKLFMRELAIAQDIGYDPRDNMQIFIERMRKAINRKGRPWGEPDFLRYLGYCKKRNWIMKLSENGSAKERIVIPPLLANAAEHDYRCVVKFEAKWEQPQMVENYAGTHSY